MRGSKGTQMHSSAKLVEKKSKHKTCIVFQSYSWLSALLHTAYLFISFGNIGAMYDGWWGAAPLEAARCAAFFAVISYNSVFENEMINSVVWGYCAFSAVVWTFRAFVQRGAQNAPKNKTK